MKIDQGWQWKDSVKWAVLKAVSLQFQLFIGGGVYNKPLNRHMWPLLYVYYMDEVFVYMCVISETTLIIFICDFHKMMTNAHSAVHLLLTHYYIHIIL